MRLDCSYKMVTQVDPPNLQGDASSSFWLRASPYTFFLASKHTEGRRISRLGA